MTLFFNETKVSSAPSISYQKGKPKRKGGGVTELSSTVLVTHCHCVSQVKSKPFILLLLGVEAITGRYPQPGGCKILLVSSALLNQAVLQVRTRILKLSLALVPSRAYSSLGIQLYLQYMLCHI